MSTKTRWMVALTLCLLLGAASLSGAAEPTVLTVFTSGDINYLESTRLFFDEVERVYPEIKIEMEIGTLEKFMVMYASGIVPDLLRLYNNVHEYAGQGLIQSLEPFMATSHLRHDDFVPVLVDRSLSYEGELYSLPFGISITTMFTNNDRFDQAGLGLPDESWRWEVEGIDAAQKLTRIDPNTGLHEYYFMGAFWDMYPLDAFIHSAGGEVFDINRDFTGDSPEVVAVLDFLYNLRANYQAFPLTTSSGGPWNLINQRSSIMLSGSWYVSALLLEELPFKWDIGLWPTMNGGRGTTLWPETPWAIPTGAPNPELAWKVIEFIGSAEGQELAMQLGLATPPYRLETMSTAFLNHYQDINIGNVAQMIMEPLTKPYFGTGLPANVRSTWSQTVNSVLNGSKPARQAVEEARPVIESMMREYFGEGA